MSGPVLIATNPFKEVELYGNDYVTAYRQKLLDSPHVYSVADTAYNEMMRGEPTKNYNDMDEMFLVHYIC